MLDALPIGLDAAGDPGRGCRGTLQGERSCGSGPSGAMSEAGTAMAGGRRDPARVPCDTAGRVAPPGCERHGLRSRRGRHAHRVRRPDRRGARLALGAACRLPLSRWRWWSCAVWRSSSTARPDQGTDAGGRKVVRTASEAPPVLAQGMTGPAKVSGRPRGSRSVTAAPILMAAETVAVLRRASRMIAPRRAGRRPSCCLGLCFRSARPRQLTA